MPATPSGVRRRPAHPARRSGLEPGRLVVGAADQVEELAPLGSGIDDGPGRPRADLPRSATSSHRLSYRRISQVPYQWWLAACRSNVPDDTVFACRGPIVERSTKSWFLSSPCGLVASSPNSLTKPFLRRRFCYTCNYVRVFRTRSFAMRLQSDWRSGRHRPRPGRLVALSAMPETTQSALTLKGHGPSTEETPRGGSAGRQHSSPRCRPN